MGEQKCKLFDILIDHISSDSGWKRCLECINAEENKMRKEYDFTNAKPNPYLKKIH